MGATCTTQAVLPSGKARSRILSIKKAYYSATSNTHKGNFPSSAGLVARHREETEDEEEDAEVAVRIPKFAREMIENLDQEEAAIDSEDIDPILLTKIRPESLKYEFVRDNGTKQLFRASSLIDYMLTTRHFHDPETRIEFTNDQLSELDKFGIQLGKDSVLSAKLDGEWMKQKIEDDEDAFAGVERLAGEHVFEMIRFIERTKKIHAQDAELELLCRVFPYYRHYLGLMYSLNAEDTIIAVDQFKRFLVGPPNRPTVDRTKVLLKFCLNFMDEAIGDLWTGVVQ